MIYQITHSGLCQVCLDKQHSVRLLLWLHLPSGPGFFVLKLFSLQHRCSLILHVNSLKRVARAAREGSSFLQGPEHSCKGERSPGTGQGGHSHSQAFGGNRKKTPHRPMGLNLSSHQETETKLRRKALPPSHIPSGGSSHHRHPPPSFND